MEYVLTFISFSEYVIDIMQFLIIIDTLIIRLIRLTPEIVLYNIHIQYIRIFFFLNKK